MVLMMSRTRLWVAIGLLVVLVILYLPLMPVKSNALVVGFGCVGMYGGYDSIGHALIGWGSMWNTPCMMEQATLFIGSSSDAMAVLITGTQGFISLALDIVPFLVAIIAVLAAPDLTHRRL